MTKTSKPAHQRLAGGRRGVGASSDSGIDDKTTSGQRKTCSIVQRAFPRVDWFTGCAPRVWHLPATLARFRLAARVFSRVTQEVSSIAAQKHPAAPIFFAQHRAAARCYFFRTLRAHKLRCALLPLTHAFYATRFTAAQHDGASVAFLFCAFVPRRSRTRGLHRCCCAVLSARTLRISADCSASDISNISKSGIVYHGRALSRQRHILSRIFFIGKPHRGTALLKTGGGNMLACCTHRRASFLICIRARACSRLPLTIAAAGALRSANISCQQRV